MLFLPDAMLCPPSPRVLLLCPPPYCPPLPPKPMHHGQLPYMSIAFIFSSFPHLRHPQLPPPSPTQDPLAPMALFDALAAMATASAAVKTMACLHVGARHLASLNHRLQGLSCDKLGAWHNCVVPQQRALQCPFAQAHTHLSTPSVIALPWTHVHQMVRVIHCLNPPSSRFLHGSRRFPS
jgi:hypothetical protein